jgi:mono/diheme cytochrome c family protein
VEGWHAPALNGASPSPMPWTVDRLVSYLRKGVDDVHGAAAGPMKPVVHNLSGVPEQDVRAMATYVISLDPRPAAERERQADDVASRGASTPSGNGPGQAMYASACAVCHGANRREHGALRLSQSTAVHLPTPQNLIRIIREGIVPAEGEAGPWMPEFGSALTDQQLTDLVTYMRARFSTQPAWRDVAGEVRRTNRAALQVSRR